MPSYTRPRDRIARIILVGVLVLALGYVALDVADALVTLAAAFLALGAAWRVLVCDALPLYGGAVRHVLVAGGAVLTSPVAALILLNVSGACGSPPIMARGVVAISQGLATVDDTGRYRR